MKKNNRIFKTGIYYLLLIALSLTVAILGNLVLEKLPVSLTQKNMNQAGILNFSDETEVFLDTMTQDATVYWIVQGGREDNYIQRILEQFQESSSHITVEKIDPVQQPRFASQYTTKTITQNSLIVVSGSKSRYIDYSDIYLQGESSSTATFQGEGQVLSALDYVTRLQDIKIYTLTGHGETALPEGILSVLSAQNYQVETLDLVSAGGVPADCGCLIINGITTDIPNAEGQLLVEYLNAGGSLCVFSTWLDSSTTNWNTILSAYGLSVQAGIVVEGQDDAHISDIPYYVLPSIAQHAITQGLAQSGLRVLVPLSQGLVIAEELPTGVTVQPLLKTSVAAYGKTAGFAMQTTAREDSDLSGPFLLGAVAERAVESGESKLVWFPSSYILDDTINTTVSGGNSQLLVGCIQYLSDDDSTLTISGKALGGGSLLVSSTATAVLSVVMMVLLPAGLIAAGIIVVRRRKRR